MDARKEIRVKVEIDLHLTVLDSEELQRLAIADLERDENLNDSERALAKAAIGAGIDGALTHLIDPNRLVDQLQPVEVVSAVRRVEEVDA